jgi:ABC-2 type transport system permease protein
VQRLSLPSLMPFATLVRRRFELTVRRPRELFVPLLTPLLFALVIAPALKAALHTSGDYEAFVALGTVGLLVPLNALFSGLSAIGDREGGAQRELLAAPVPRPLLVFANAVVTLATTSLQIAVLIGAAALRGISFHASTGGVFWAFGAIALLTLAMAGVAETLASRVPSAEEYTARVPAIAIAPWFLAGSLFPIAALPAGLTWFAKFLPLTHVLSLVRYGLLGDASGLHQVWGGGDARALAAASLGVAVVFAFGLAALAVRTFSRAAVA